MTTELKQLELDAAKLLGIDLDVQGQYLWFKNTDDLWQPASDWNHTMRVVSKLDGVSIEMYKRGDYNTVSIVSNVSGPNFLKRFDSEGELQPALLRAAVAFLKESRAK